MISVVQNFICTKEKRLKVIQNEVPNMSRVFRDYEFFINYNSEYYFDEVYEVYRSNVDKLNFYNNLESDWGLVTVVDGDKIRDIAPLNQIKVLAYKDKGDWILETKYNIGSKKKKVDE